MQSDQPIVRGTQCCRFSSQTSARVVRYREASASPTSRHDALSSIEPSGKSIASAFACSWLLYSRRATTESNSTRFIRIS